MPDLSDAASIGARIRKLRQERGLKQQDLASGEISVSYVSLIETGKRAPSDQILSALAERLGCSVEYLRSGRDDSRTEELKVKISFADVAMRNGANGEALRAYSEALAAAPFLDAGSVRRAQLGQALALEKLGRLEAAIELLTTLFEDGRSVPGQTEWTQLAVALCRCYRQAGDFTLAVEIGERAMQRLNTLGLDTTDDHIQLGSTLVSAYEMRGDLTRAHLLAEQLIQRADETGSRIARGSIYWNAAAVARSRGQHSEAFALSERALALMAESDSARHIALLKAQIVHLMLERGVEGELEQAEELLTQAHEVLIEVGMAADQAGLEMLRGRLLLHAGKPVKAQEAASRSIGLLRNEPRWETVDARTLLAEAQQAAGDLDAARATLEAGSRQLAQIAPSRAVAESWRQIGDLWLSLHAMERALEAYQRALAGVGLQDSRARRVGTAMPDLAGSGGNSGKRLS